jgi:hypothetical protein
MQRRRSSANAAPLQLCSDREFASCLPLMSVRVCIVFGAAGSSSMALLVVAGKQTALRLYCTAPKLATSSAVRVAFVSYRSPWIY